MRRPGQRPTHPITGGAPVGAARRIVSVPEQQRRRLVRRCLRTLDRGDTEAIDALVDEFVAPGYVGRFAGRALQGRAAVKAYFAAASRVFLWFQHTIRGESVDGDWVRVRAILRGEMREGAMPGDASRFAWPIAYGHRVADGRIVEGWHEGRPVIEVMRHLDRLHV